MVANEADFVFLWSSLKKCLEALIIVLGVTNCGVIQGKEGIIARSETFLDEMIRRDRREERKSREGISDNILAALDVDDTGSIFFDNETPTANAIRCEVVKRKVLVVRIDVDGVPEKDRAIILEGFHDREELKFSDSVAGLRVREFSGIEGERTTLLHNDRTKLFHACICVDVEWNREIRVCQTDLFGNGELEGVECLLFDCSPSEASVFGRELDKRSEVMRAMRNHLFVVVNHTNEGADLADVGRRRNVKDGVDLLLLWLDSIWCEDEAKEFSFPCAKAAFRGIDLEVGATDAEEDFAELREVVIKGSLCDESEVIEIHNELVDVGEKGVHRFLVDIWCIAQTHGESLVTVFAPRKHDGAERARVFVEFECPVTHIKVQGRTEIEAFETAECFWD